MVKFILLKETHPCADSQMNLILEIFSEWVLLQENRTMLKNSILITVVKRKVRNGVYIFCTERDKNIPRAPSQQESH